MNKSLLIFLSVIGCASTSLIRPASTELAGDAYTAWVCHGEHDHSMMSAGYQSTNRQPATSSQLRDARSKMKFADLSDLRPPTRNQVKSCHCESVAVLSKAGVYFVDDKIYHLLTSNDQAQLNKDMARTIASIQPSSAEAKAQCASYGH